MRDRNENQGWEGGRVVACRSWYTKELAQVSLATLDTVKVFVDDDDDEGAKTSWPPFPPLYVDPDALHQVQSTRPRPLENYLADDVTKTTNMI